MLLQIKNTNLLVICLSISLIISFVYYYFEAWYLVFLILPVCGYFIIKRPINGIYLLLPLTVIVPPAPQEIGPLEIAYMGLWGFTVFAWMIKFEYIKRVQYFQTRLTTPILALFALIFISFFTRQMHDTTLYHWVRGVIPFLNLLIFFVLLSEIKDISDVKRLIWIFRVTGILIIINVGVSVLPVLSAAIPAGNFIQIRSSLEAGSFGPLTIMLPAFLFSLWSNPYHRRKLDLIILIALLLIIMVTFLRSAVIILSFIAIIVLYKTYKKSGVYMLGKIILPVLLFVGLVIVGYFISDIVHSFMDLIFTGFFSRFDRLTTLGDVRTLETQEVLQHYTKSPIIGHGLGFQFSYDRGEFMSGGQTFIWSGGYTHNIFTYFLLVFGAVGVTILLWIIYSVWKEYRVTIKYYPNNVIEGYLSAVGMGLLAMFLYANFQSVYRSISYSLVLSILLAIIIKLRRFIFQNKGTSTI